MRKRNLEQLAGGLELAFFGLALLALLFGLTGSPGLGLLLLVLAGAAHVVRAGLEEAGMVASDGRSRALPILRRGAVAAQAFASAAWTRARAAVD